jgi:hypothetical protein
MPPPITLPNVKRSGSISEAKKLGPLNQQTVVSRDRLYQNCGDIVAALVEILLDSLLVAKLGDQRVLSEIVRHTGR